MPNISVKLGFEGTLPTTPSLSYLINSLPGLTLPTLATLSHHTVAVTTVAS